MGLFLLGETALDASVVVKQDKSKAEKNCGHDEVGHTQFDV